MAAQSLPEILFLGAVEGLTEFLPVSSTGHLIFFADLLGFEATEDKVFEIVIQTGAILAVCLLYFGRLWKVLLGMAAGDRAAWRFAVAVGLAFLPAAAAGVLLHDFIKDVLFSPFVVALSLIAGGFAMLAAERFYTPLPSVHEVEDFSPALALKIGCAQCLALVPGVSRSGATIIGALLMGVERKAAAEFSFFLAIPTIAGATVYDLWKSRDALTPDGMSAMALGFAAAFAVAWLVIRWFVGFVSTRGFAPFAWYRIAFGGVILGWLYF